MKVDRIARLEGVADNEDVLQLDRLHMICAHTLQEMSKGEGRARGKCGFFGYVEDKGVQISHGITLCLEANQPELSRVWE